MSTDTTARDFVPQPPDAPGAQAARSSARPGRERLDVLLVARGLAPSRERARALIMAHEVRVNGETLTKAGTLVARDATCELAGAAAELRYASRGGLKLERALDTFALDPAGCVCLDVGASTGGFTDLLLRRGACRVYAVDVGHGQLAWALQNDPRVVVLDRTNIRHLAALPEPADCAVIDVSFISLRLVLPTVARLVRPDGWIVALVKPQFEAGRAEVARGAGIIGDPTIHRRILRDLLAIYPPSLSVSSVSSEVPSISPSGPRLAARGLIASPITGRDGNHEYLVWLAVGVGETSDDAPPTQPDLWSETTIDTALHEAFGEALRPDTAPKRPHATKSRGT